MHIGIDVSKVTPEVAVSTQEQTRQAENTPEGIAPCLPVAYQVYGARRGF